DARMRAEHALQQRRAGARRRQDEQEAVLHLHDWLRVWNQACGQSRTTAPPARRARARSRYRARDDHLALARRMQCAAGEVAVALLDREAVVEQQGLELRGKE